MDRNERMAPLGPVRARVLDCLGGNSRWAPGYFDPTGDVDILAAFRAHIHKLVAEWGTSTDPTALSLLAAGRLLTGDVSAAREIVDRLPEKAPQLDHGAGHCLVAAPQTLRAVLPLPPELADSKSWLAGSAEQASLRQWLSENESRLRWVEKDGVYVAG